MLNTVRTRVSRGGQVLRDLGVPLPQQPPSYPVADKVALITGGANGIGFALARRLHTRGATVALVDVNEAALSEAKTALGGARVMTVTADVGDRAAMAAAVQHIVDMAGTVDVVVANAGVTPSPCTVRMMDPAEFDRVLTTNVTGVFNTVQPAIDEVIARRGHIMVVASAAAFSPAIGGASYVLSKAAVEQLGRLLRLELAAHRVTVGVALFGIVDTQLTQTTLDNDPLGSRLNARLPRPLRRRITADAAAQTLLQAITRRASSTIEPGAWQPWALLRGLVNVVIDGVLVADIQTHLMIRELESRAERQRQAQITSSGTHSRRLS